MLNELAPQKEVTKIRIFVETCEQVWPKNSFPTRRYCMMACTSTKIEIKIYFLPYQGVSMKRFVLK